VNAIANRVFSIATNGFREVMRDRIFWVIGFYALIVVAAWRLLPDVSIGADRKILADVGAAAASLLGVVVAIFVGTGLVNKEIEKRTVFVLVTKPVNRAEFIIGKHLGLSGVMAVVVAGMTAIYMLVLHLAKVSYQPTPILIASVYLFLELLVIIAAAIVFGVFTSSILAALLTFSLYIVGHLGESMVKLADVTKNPEFQKFTNNLYLFLPDLSRFNLKNDAVYGIIPPPGVLLGNAGYAILYSSILLAIAIFIFSKREF
jgi:ABC-type transport system involved in multi-copper enzyme maturation permease subunit